MNSEWGGNAQKCFLQSMLSEMESGGAVRAMPVGSAGREGTPDSKASRSYGVQTHVPGTLRCVRGQCDLRWCSTLHSYNSEHLRKTPMSITTPDRDFGQVP